MSSPSSCSSRRKTNEMYAQAMVRYYEARQKVDRLELEVEQQKVYIKRLHNEINKVGDWFLQNADELIEEGSACDNAVRWLNYFALEKDIPTPASPDVLEPDVDEEAHY